MFQIDWFEFNAASINDVARPKIRPLKFKLFRVTRWERIASISAKAQCLFAFEEKHSVLINERVVVTRAH
jgi:hypothetical protein